MKYRFKLYLGLYLIVSVFHSTTYEGPGVLVHQAASTHCLTERLLEELGRSEVREALTQVNGLVVSRQLRELNPVTDGGRRGGEAVGRGSAPVHSELSGDSPGILVSRTQQQRCVMKG